MAINPKHTYLKLVHTEFTDEHQLTFNSVNAQKQFFDSLQGLVVNDFSYQRKDSTIRFEIEFEDVEKYNYVIYYNTDDLDPKYYYAYIVNLEYKNDSLVEITIATDVFQTWQFDFIYKKCFVERKHVTDDIAGNHTIAEPVATGEYVLNDSQQYGNLNRSDNAYVIQFTEPYDNTGYVPLAINYGGLVLSGGAYVTDDALDIPIIIDRYVQAQVSTDSIYNIYCVPKFFIDYDFDNPPSDMYYRGQTDPIVDSFSIGKPSTLNGYSPTNKKLLTYPYCYMTLSNICGTVNILQYEKFINQTNTCDFFISGVPTPRLFY